MKTYSVIATNKDGRSGNAACYHDIPFETTLSGVKKALAYCKDNADREFHIVEKTSTEKKYAV